MGCKIFFNFWSNRTKIINFDYKWLFRKKSNCKQNFWNLRFGRREIWSREVPSFCIFQNGIRTQVFLRTHQNSKQCAHFAIDPHFADRNDDAIRRVTDQRNRTADSEFGQRSLRKGTLHHRILFVLENLLFSFWLWVLIFRETKTNNLKHSK